MSLILDCCHDVRVSPVMGRRSSYFASDSFTSFPLRGFSCERSSPLVHSPVGELVHPSRVGDQTLGVPCIVMFNFSQLGLEYDPAFLLFLVVSVHFVVGFLEACP